jgi:hypothetical protein
VRSFRPDHFIVAALLVTAVSASAQTPAPATTAPAAAAGSATQAGKPADSTAKAALAADSLPNFFRDIQANFFASSGYTSNLNHAAGGTNGLRVFDSPANTFGVDVAELVLQKSVSKIGDAGFRVDLEAGSTIPAKTQAVGLSIGSGADLQQAFFSYIAPVGPGLRLDLGKFVTHLGLEVIEGYDGYNDNYSRSLLFNYAIPLTHTGIKGSYTFNSVASAMVMVVNGWDNAVDNNSSKSIGAQLALTPVSAVSVYLNYMGGPEKADTNGYVRQIFDVAGTWKVTDAFTLGVNADYGSEDKASLVKPGDNAVWSGVAGYGRLAINDRVSFALRGETFKDEGGTRLGTTASTTVNEITFTPAYKFNRNFLVRAEGRYDTVNQDGFFTNDKGTAKRSQATICLNAIFVF